MDKPNPDLGGQSPASREPLRSAQDVDEAARGGRERLLADIEVFLAEAKLKPSWLGWKANRDGGLVARLRGGGDVTLTTADAVRRVMAEERDRRAAEAEALRRRAVELEGAPTVPPPPHDIPDGAAP